MANDGQPGDWFLRNVNWYGNSEINPIKGKESNEGRIEKSKKKQKKPKPNKANKRTDAT